MSYEKIVTLFDTMENANVAKKNLMNAGFASSDISVMTKQDLLAGGSTATREPGLWARMFGSDIEKHEAEVYRDAIDSGGTVLTLRCTDTEVPKAMGILNQHKVVDVQNRAIETGVLPKANAVPIAAVAQAAIPATPVTAELPKDQVLRLAEEQLNVGKQLVEEGTTRIRRFVTERPVEAKVTLHEEHADVVRRAVSDPHYVQDIDWADRTVEVRETSERPVVSKSARVVEEVAIGKKGSDRVETVHDTVRRQQVEVEKTGQEKRSDQP